MRAKIIIAGKCIVGLGILLLLAGLVGRAINVDSLGVLKPLPPTYEVGILRYSAWRDDQLDSIQLTLVVGQTGYLDRVNDPLNQPTTHEEAKRHLYELSERGSRICKLNPAVLAGGVACHLSGYSLDQEESSPLEGVSASCWKILQMWTGQKSRSGLPKVTLDQLRPLATGASSSQYLLYDQTGRVYGTFVSDYGEPPYIEAACTQAMLAYASGIGMEDRKAGILHLGIPAVADILHDVGFHWGSDTQNIPNFCTDSGMYKMEGYPDWVVLTSPGPRTWQIKVYDFEYIGKCRSFPQYCINDGSEYDGTVTAQLHRESGWIALTVDGLEDPFWLKEGQLLRLQAGSESDVYLRWSADYPDVEWLQSLAPGSVGPWTVSLSPGWKEYHPVADGNKDPFQEDYVDQPYWVEGEGLIKR